MKHDGKGTGGSHSADESHDTEQDDAEVIRGEEFMVEEEDGNLDHAETDRVDNLDNPANLEC